MVHNVVAFPSRASALNRTATISVVPVRLRDARLAKGHNQTDLANTVGISRQAISAFEAGDKRPDPATMMRIAEALEQPMAFFTAEDPQGFGEPGTRFFRAFGADTKRRNSMSDVLGKWFVHASRYLFDLVNFPTVKIPSLSPKSGDRYTEEEIEEAAEECRRQWGLGSGPISSIIGLLENNGVIVCRYEMKDQKVEAFSFWNGPRPFIFLSSEKQTAVRARFDAAHELGHLVLHRWMEPEEIEDPRILKAVEAEANRFAGALLLPRKAFPNEIYSPRLDAFVELKKRWKVAIQAMIYRCRDLAIFDETQVTNLYKQISYRRWRTTEPLDDILPLERPKLLCKAIEIVVDSGKKMKEDISREMHIGSSVITRLCGLPLDYFQPEVNQDFFPVLR